MRKKLSRVVERGSAASRLLFRYPDAAMAFLRWKPFSITSFEMARGLRTLGIQPALVIDGGANVGQFARAMLETFPQAEVVSFEPLPAAAQQFQAHLGNESRCQLIEKALGDFDGTITFHPQEYDLASSVLPPLSETGSASIEVPIVRLDSALDETLEQPVLLKLDLQGYEVVALRGAEKLLPIVQWVLVEIGFVPSYIGEATFENVYDFLREHGFRFRGPIDFLRAANGEIVQMDALFERQT